jgi:hypothetical protein
MNTSCAGPIGFEPFARPDEMLFEALVYGPCQQENTINDLLNYSADPFSSV